MKEPIWNASVSVLLWSSCAQNVASDFFQVIEVKKWTIYVKLPSGETISIDLDNVAPVRDIKEIVHTRDGTLPSVQVLKVTHWWHVKPSQKVAVCQKTGQKERNWNRPQQPAKNDICVLDFKQKTGGHAPATDGRRHHQWSCSHCGSWGNACCSRERRWFCCWDEKGHWAREGGENTHAITVCCLVSENMS